MSNDERPDSLAAQAAAWVPPWERAPREPDRDFQAAAEGEARAELAADSQEDASPASETGDEPERGWRASARASGGAADSGPAIGAPDDTESIDEAGLSDDDDDFDPAFEGPNPTVEPGVPGSAVEPNDDRGPELGSSPDGTEGDSGPEVPGPEVEAEDESAGVDAEVDLTASELEPVDVAPGPELPVPASIEDAAESADDDEPGIPVDAPLPQEGDDAGDVFDAAADDDVSDDGELDLPFADEVPVSDTEDDPEDDTDTVDEDDDDDVVGSARQAEANPPGEVGGAVTAAVAESATVPGQTRRAASPPVEAPPMPEIVLEPNVEDGPSRLPEVELPGLSEDAELAAALEAIMLVVDEPVAELQLAQILEQPTERIAVMLDNLSASYTAAGHGFDLRRVSGGWRLYTRPEYAAYVERFVLDGQSVRLTQAALETLAVVAYKQPVTRSRISAIRGVNCDGVMRTLVTRGLIEECGTEGETGAYLYRTTGLFLEKLGLNTVDQLPPLAPFLPDDVEEVLDATG